MTHPSRHRRRTKVRSWYVWHRWLGVSAALLVVLLAVTGIALNHTEALHLDERQIHNQMLLNWYGIGTPEHIASFEVPGGPLSQAGTRWYLNERPLPGEFGALQGAVGLDGLLVAASPGAVYLLTDQGEIAERLDANAGLPSDMQRIGLDAQQRVVIEADSGFYRGDQALVRWQRITQPGPMQWSEAQPVPDGLREHLLQQYRGPGLPLERVVLDLHSGRIFGAWGVYLMDAAAVVLLVLAGSGVWLWLRARLRRRRS